MTTNTQRRTLLSIATASVGYIFTGLLLLVLAGWSLDAGMEVLPYTIAATGLVTVLLGLRRADAIAYALDAETRAKLFFAIGGVILSIGLGMGLLTSADEGVVGFVMLTFVGLAMVAAGVERTGAVAGSMWKGVALCSALWVVVVGAALVGLSTPGSALFVVTAFLFIVAWLFLPVSIFLDARDPTHGFQPRTLLYVSVAGIPVIGALVGVVYLIRRRSHVGTA